MNSPLLALGLGLLIMAASPDTQEELDTHSTSEYESVDFCDSGDDLESASWAGINLSLIYKERARVNVTCCSCSNNSPTRTWAEPQR